MQPIITNKLYKDDPKTGTNITYSPQKYMYQIKKKKTFSWQHVVTGQIWETHSLQIKNLNIEWKFNQESQLLKPYLKLQSSKHFLS